MPDQLLRIGELARYARAATSALRYCEQLGLLKAATRASWQRRHPESAARLAGIILLLRNAGFAGPLAQIRESKDQEHAERRSRSRRSPSGSSVRADAREVLARVDITGAQQQQQRRRPSGEDDDVASGAHAGGCIRDVAKRSQQFHPRAALGMLVQLMVEPVSAK